MVKISLVHFQLKASLKTCPKGFGRKVAKLSLNTPLKMKDILIGTKTIAQQTPEQWSQAIAQAKLSKA